MSTDWDIVLRIIYILLSATLVSLPLVSFVPQWMKILPFYRKAALAANFICDRKKEILEEFPSIKGKGTAKLAVSCVKRGDIGFDELLKAIKANNKIRLSNVERICLSWGNIPIETPLGYTPNSVLFVGDKEIGCGTADPIIFNAFAALHPNDIRETLLNWIKIEVQARLAKYTAIVLVFWVSITTLLVFA